MEHVERKSLKQMSRSRDLWKRIKKYWPLLLLIMVPLSLVFIFNYAAYPGLRIVFMNYKPALGCATPWCSTSWVWRCPSPRPLCWR